MTFLNEIYDALIRFHPFMMGAAFALSAIASVLFFRFFRKTGDRLFLFFSWAFALLAVNRIAFLAMDSPSEMQPVLYLVRLLAFCLIIYAIIDKNRTNRSRKKF